MAVTRFFYHLPPYFKPFVIQKTSECNSFLEELAKNFTHFICREPNNITV